MFNVTSTNAQILLTLSSRLVVRTRLIYQKSPIRRKKMSPIRRIYRRVTTTEKISVPLESMQHGTSETETFRVEIFAEHALVERSVYEPELGVRLSLDEPEDGSIFTDGDRFPESE